MRDQYGGGTNLWPIALAFLILIFAAGFWAGMSLT